jgi:hypothetical protein
MLFHKKFAMADVNSEDVGHTHTLTPIVSRSIGLWFTNFVFGEESGHETIRRINDVCNGVI